MHRFLKNNPKLESEKQKLSQLQGKAKLQYIWDYYKLPILVACVIFYILGYTLYGHFSEKEILLSAAFVNVAPGEELTEQLSNGFLDAQDVSSEKNEVRLYTGLYLTDDENDPNSQYVYASRIKILGTIDSEGLDVVFMNQEAFDSFAQNGYLYNMEELLSQTDAALYRELSPFLCTNTEILEDNADEVAFDDSIAYSAKTEEYPMALKVSKSPLIQKAKMNGDIYLGIVGNTPHLETSIEYIRYLWDM